MSDEIDTNSTGIGVEIYNRESSIYAWALTFTNVISTLLYCLYFWSNNRGIKSIDYITFPSIKPIMFLTFVFMYFMVKYDRQKLRGVGIPSPRIPSQIWFIVAPVYLFLRSYHLGRRQTMLFIMIAQAVLAKFIFESLIGL